MPPRIPNDEERRRVAYADAAADIIRRRATGSRVPSADGLGTPPFPSGMPVPPELAGMQAAPGAMGAGPIGPRLPGAMGVADIMPPQAVGKKEIEEAQGILQKYKQGKQNLEQRVVEDELWWELRHWEAIRHKKTSLGTLGEVLEPTSAWLFNVLLNKHADVMDNAPEPIILPRERSDEDSAKMLTSVVPVILENRHYEDTYSDAWWEKLKHGTSCYFVGWNPKLENGLGDIEVKQLDLLNIFWEPGIEDIQDSRNLFIVELVDKDLLEEQYPEHIGHLDGDAIDIAKYNYDENIDLSNKSLVVDWYYKREDSRGRKILHYARFVGDTLLYASQNQPDLAERGFYDHGEYPVVLDVLFPEKGTPMGFGWIAVGRDPQMYIDKLYGYMLDHARMAANPRWWVSSSTNVNEDEFLDPTRKLIHVEGELDDRRISQFVMQPVSSAYINLLTSKIDELKETTVNSGGVTGGVTSAAGISALLEVGNKLSRDMISAGFRAFARIVDMVIENMRQFYEESRAFRITDPNQPWQGQYVSVSNAMLKDQPLPPIPGQTEMLFRRPVFDIKVKIQKKTSLSRMEQNERAKELYSMGFFQPEQAQAAMGALDMMEFEGIEKVREYVSQGQTLMNLVQQLTQAVQQLTGQMTDPMAPPDQGAGGPPQESDGAANKSAEKRAMNSQQANMTPYQQRMMENARVNITRGSDQAMPGGGA